MTVRAHSQLRLVVVAVCLAGAARLAGAQTCVPADTSYEAEIFGVRSLSLAMSRGTSPIPTDFGAFRIGGEMVLLPHIDEGRQPTCRANKRGENVNELPVAARARVVIGLPRGFSLEASWLPPVEIRHMKGNVVGVALGYARVIGERSTLGARAHATFGKITGPFTCDDEDVASTANEVCFGGTRSNDRLEPRVIGGDVSIGWSPPVSPWTWFAGGGVSRLSPRFQVHFVDASAVLDTLRVRMDLNRIAVFGGVSRALGTKWRASAEVYATTDDGATARFVVDRSIRLR